jgi:tRNA threonylcarbamoyl adenosine modification protein (Sua5/YciO/YrdC/YwlC family)
LVLPFFLSLFMLLKIYPENPQPRAISKVLDVIEKGGVIIYPTDSVYGMGCDIHQPKAIERVAQIKGIDVEKAQFSIIFRDLSQISEYCKLDNNSIFKLLKRNLPGPFTFILNAGSKVPKIFTPKKKTVGIRIPDNNIIKTIVEELGRPILTTSVKDDDQLIEYTTDPELIHERYKSLVDIVIDGGFGHNIASTVVDCTGGEPVIVRQGIGMIEI